MDNTDSVYCVYFHKINKESCSKLHWGPKNCLIGPYEKKTWESGVKEPPLVFSSGRLYKAKSKQEETICISIKDWRLIDVQESDTAISGTTESMHLVLGSQSRKLTVLFYVLQWQYKRKPNICKYYCYGSVLKIKQLQKLFYVDLLIIRY